MSQLEKLLAQVISGRADANIAFADLCRLLHRLGFAERTRGSHHIFSREGIEERISAGERCQGQALSGQTGAGRDRQIRPGGKGVMHKYEMIIYWSDEDGAFVVDVPELPGCMAHGDTREEALRAANEAVALWVETAREEGRPVPEPKGRRLMYA